jgi:hypothetical protein
MRVFLEQRLPVSRTHASAAFALFIAVQIADACSTAAGIAHFGASIEGNPLLLLCMSTFGVTTALIVWKGVAILAGGILHACSRHLALAALTVFYVFAAVLPWAWVLSQ